jgi:hypothetical protein
VIGWAIVRSEYGFCLQEETNALHPKQVQQFSISTMSQRPLHLRLLKVLDPKRPIREADTMGRLLRTKV